jgi:hypothetical protein
LSKAQGKKDKSIPLISYLEVLESIFNVKFSYANEAIQSIRIISSTSENLEGILLDIKAQLNERYYIITSFNINIYETILDNFVIGANLGNKWNSDFATCVNMYYIMYNLDSKNNLAITFQELYQNNKVLETAIQLSSSYNLSKLSKSRPVL